MEIMENNYAMAWIGLRNWLVELILSELLDERANEVLDRVYDKMDELNYEHDLLCEFSPAVNEECDG